jgi:hypothetical protein
MIENVLGNNCSIYVQYICILDQRSRYFYTGWSGAVHDQRVFKETLIYEDYRELFLANEYILADSAYTCTCFVIPVFKKPPSSQLCRKKEKFNKTVAHLRIAVEHGIGMLKARFQSLKSLRFTYADEHKMVRIVKHIECCVILHNLLITDIIPDEWLEKTDVERVEDAERIRANAIQDTIEDNGDDMNLDIFVQGRQRRDEIAEFISSRSSN